MPDGRSNHYARLTPSAASALAVVRLSGPDVGTFLNTRFSRPAIQGRPVHGILRDDAGVIDDPVVVMGEHGADIVLHGSPWIVEMACRLLERHGFSASEPLPRSIEEETEAALPAVKSDLAARVLLAQSAAWATLPTDVAALQAMLSDRSLWRLLYPPTVAIVGPPNAGKSTLANALFGTERAITSPVAGTTRDWVGELANLDGLVVRLVDTPGVHETSDTIEQRAIATATGIAREADLIVRMFDGARHDPIHDGVMMKSEAQTIFVLNKADLLSPDWLHQQPAKPTIIPVVALSGHGLERLTRAIQDAFQLFERPISAPRIWTDRQRNEIESRIYQSEAGQRSRTT